eukprot:1869246-Prymnesium_polylepis.1
MLSKRPPLATTTAAQGADASNVRNAAPSCLVEPSTDGSPTMHIDPTSSSPVPNSVCHAAASRLPARRTRPWLRSSRAPPPPSRRQKAMAAGAASIAE